MKNLVLVYIYFLFYRKMTINIGKETFFLKYIGLLLKIIKVDLGYGGVRRTCGVRRTPSFTLKVLDWLLWIIIFCYIIIVNFVSNFQTVYFSTKVFLALKVRFKRKLLKKWQKIPIPTTHLNWKTVNPQQFQGTIF